MKFPEKLILKKIEELVAENQRKLHISVCIWSCSVRSDNLLESIFFFLQGSRFTSYTLSLQGNSNYWFQSFLIYLLFYSSKVFSALWWNQAFNKIPKISEQFTSSRWQFSHVHLAFRRGVWPNIFWRRIHLALTKTKNSPMTYFRQINIT